MDDLAYGWDTEDNKQLVYSGDYTFQTGDWNRIELDNAFEYDNDNGNLLITCRDITGSWGSTNNFYVNTPSGSSAKLTRYVYQDAGAYDLNYGGTASGTLYAHNDIRFEIETVTYEEGRVPVDNLTVNYVTDETVSNGNALTSYQVPVNNLWNNSFTEQIYTPEEVSGAEATLIKTIAFQYAHSTAMTDKNNVDIYLTTTDKEQFASKTDMIPFEGLTPVYSGALNCKSGWNTFTLNTPFAYDGQSNLVVIVYDHSGDWNGSSYKFNAHSATSTTNKVLYYYSDDYSDPAYMSQYLGNSRSNIAFGIDATQSTNLTHNNGYKELGMLCHSAYESTVFVVDNNGCKSNVVTFNYEVGDTLAPVVTPNNYSVSVNTCDSATLAAAAEQYIFNSIEALDEYLKNVEDAQATYGAYDNCAGTVAISHVDAFTPAGDGCEIKITRTYTLIDSCGNDTTFTHIFIGHDLDAPEFVDYVNPTADFRPIRLLPIPAGDCKYNAPSLQAMKDKIRPYVTDACTDVDYMMNNIVFIWENLSDTIPVADAQDIFLRNNHLTISAYMHDKCNNWSDTVRVFFLDLPDKITIEENPVRPQTLCYGETTTLTFDPSTIVVDQNMGAFAPFTYTWSDTANGDVTFSDPHALSTTVTFNGAGDYYIVMTVTDTNDCVAVSEVRNIHVRPELKVTIEPVVYDGVSHEPFCPTYGNLTVKAYVEGEYVPAQTTYTWTGESVNVTSHKDTTWVTIVPEFCDTVYVPHVHVVDDHNCVADTFRNIYTAASQIVLGQLEDVVVPISDNCELIVPDFRNMMTPDMISDNCYGYSKIVENPNWYSQYPAYPYVFNTDSLLVTITIKNPCGDSAQTSLYVRKPSNYPTVTIDPTQAESCFADIAGTTFTASGTNLGLNPSYEWTILDGTTESDPISDNNTLIFPNDNWNPINEELTYTFKVTAFNNENGCDASATTQFTVHYQGDPIITQVWDNTMCTPGHYDGLIRVDTVPMFYTVILNGITVDYDSVIKINDNPNHAHSDWNSLDFDSLCSGLYQVTVINLFGCEMTKNVFVDNDNDVDFPDAIYDSTNQTECIANGTITITPEPLFTFSLMQGTELIGTGLYYDGLPAGTYTIVKTQIATGCTDETYVTLTNEAQEEVFTATHADRSDCQTANGSISVTATQAMWYRITRGNNIVVAPTSTCSDCQQLDGKKYVAVAAGTTYTFENLNAGSYHIIAYNPATGCFGYDDETIGWDTVHPHVTYIAEPNHYCSNTEGIYDGKITVTPVSSSSVYNYSLRYVGNGGYDQGTLSSTTGVFENLYPNSYKNYTYTLTVTDPANNCTFSPDSPFRISDQTYIPSIDTLSTTPNTVCVPTDEHPYNGAVVLKVTTTPATAFNTYIQPYTVTVDGVAQEGTYTSANPSFGGFQDGTHTFRVVSNYKCQSTTKYVYVKKTEIPAMVLTQEPDHFCAPTVEKPGDGLITIHVPTSESNPGHEYTYRFFFYHQPGMEVPYNYPMTTTKYWLAHDKYLVEATEPATGCVVTDTITVAWDPYTVTFDTVTTPDEFCSATAGNGTITVINAQVSNPDVVGNFVYSIDGGTTYQTSNQFTGLNADPDNPYYITVKELTTACVADSKVVFISNDSCAPIIDSIYDNFGKGNEFHYCFGAEGMYLYGAAHDACDNTELEYHWNAPCADLSESDTYSIEVMTDHAVVGGCYYTLTVRNPLTECQTTRTVKVFVHPLPELYVTINGRRAEEHFLNEYCENVPLEIVVKNLNMEPLDIASIQWSQGYTATGVDTIHIVGTDYDIDTVTICVRANNIYNCGSRVVSFPVKFNRIITTNVPMTRCDGNCFITEPNGQTTEINKPAGVDYPYETVVTRNYVSSKGCDSIVNYQITLYGPAQLAPATIVPAAFCENDVKTLADFTPAASDIDWNGLEGEATWMAAEIAPTYTKVTSAAELTTGEYVITNAAGTKAMSSVRATTNYYYPGVNFDADNVTASNITWNLTVNEDGTYSLSNDYGYLYISTSTGNAYINPTMDPTTKFTATFTNDGVKFVNNYHTGYALKFNNGANRFAGYAKDNNNNLYHLAFYKKTNDYEEVLASTRVDYAFASTHNVKYVVTNDCGSDEAFATFNVSKAPVIDQFNVAADLCNNVETTIYYTVSSYGAPATATLKLGNDVVKTTTGIVGQQIIGYTFTPNYTTQNNKVFTLTLDNGVCDPDVETQTLTIAYTTKEINNKTYCQDASFEYEDFFTASEISTYGNTLQAYRKTGNTQLADGTILTVNDNNMKVYFTFTDGCGNIVTTTDATITVNPKAQVSFNQLPHDFCLEGAADQLLTSLNKANAADSGWLYKASATATSYTTAANVNALVNAIKNMSEAQIAYHVVDANQCAYDTAYATVRILKPVQVSSDPITTCPNSEISQVINLAHATITNAGNYATSELNTTYTLVKANGTTIDVQSSSAVYTLATGDTLKVTVTPNIVPNCGVGIAKSGITVYTFDTIRPTFKVACDGQALKNFIATNPNYTGNMGIDTIYWTVVNNLQSTMVDPDTFIVSTNMNPKFRVVWNNACGQTYTSPVYNFNELNLINDKPEITLNDNFRVCEGGTISVAQTGFGVTYHGNADKYDTAWTINGVAFDFNTTLTVAQHNGKKLVVTLNDNNAACGPVTDTLTLIIDTIPVVTISGPERACVGELITFTATPAGYSSYSFTINGETFDAQTPNTYSTIASMESEEIGFEYTTASVSVKNSHNCVGTSSEVATVRVTNAPEFIFRTMDGEATHNYTSTVGQGLQYTWEVSTECFGPDKLVYVEYDIYYEDNMISNDSIGEYLATVTTIPTVGHNSQQYVTSNTFSWCANNGSPRSNTSYYNYAVANPSSISAGNHFPNTSLGLGTGHDVFDELWMSFLENCGQVTKTIVPFRRSGTYKIVYRLMATSHYQQLEYFYSPDCQPSSQLIPIGGHNALNAGAEITMLATDFVTIIVDGEDEVVSNNVAPEMAPAITMDEATVAPEMEVWPNPAPAITTTFKARVHNMSGEATVTISTLAGKQIYSNNMFIDSDNYYFEADVDNLSLGSYIMTVRTADAVISKKLVVMVSAK